jgi:acyl-ACP thioesterase
LPTPIQDGFILTRLPVSQQKLMTVKRLPIRQNLLTTWNILPENLTLVEEVDVCQNYLDTNHHVNNGQYIRLAVNVLPIDFEVSEFRAEFRLAAKMGDTMYIRTASEKGKFYVVFTDKEENPYFLSEFTPTKNGE